MRPRLALAALAFALGAVASYAVQRLWEAVGAPPPGVVLRQTSIPYDWRVAAALLHGLVLASLAGLGTDDPRARAWLGRAPWLVALVVGPAVLAMVLVP